MAAALQDVKIDMEETQGYYSHRFHRYRNGLPGHYMSWADIQHFARNGEPIMIARCDDIMNRVAVLAPPGPQPPRPTFRFRTRDRARLRALAHRKRQPLRTLPPPAKGPRLSPEVKTLVRQEYTRRYARMRSCFRYIKCLGWGGEGVVSLWKYSPGPRQEHMVVMKMTSQWTHVNLPVPKNVLDPTNIDKEKYMTSVSR
jgi:hypothetical protein